MAEKDKQAHKLDVKSILKEKQTSDAVLRFLYDESESEIRSASGYDVIRSIRSGLPKSGVDTFLKKTSVDKEQLSRVLHISSRQLSRYKSDQRLLPEQSNFLYELTRIYTRALDIFGDQATAEHWLGRQQMALGNQMPFELLDTTEGLRLVDNLLSQIEHGLYS